MRIIYPLTKRLSAGTTWIALTFLCVIFLKNAEMCTTLVTEGLEICFRSVIPSLFPYMVISALIISSGLAHYLGRLFARPLSAVFAIRGGGAAAIILGVIAGFPMGAKTAVDSYKNGLCTKEEAERLCCFCNNTGPAFLIGGIGVGFFGDAGAGVTLYIIELISVLILGIILSIGKDRRSPQVKEKIVFKPDPSEAVRSSVYSVLSVCGFVIFFRVLNGAIATILANLRLRRLSPLFFAISEVTGGGGAAADIGSLPLAAFAVGWSGLCVHAQSATFMLPEGIKMRKYLIIKALQGLLCALTCVFWQNL